MERHEFAKIAMAMRTYYPREELMPNEQAIELWYDQLRDYDYNVVSTALKKWVATNKWSPAISDLRQTAAEVMLGSIPDWGKAWEEVQDAIHIHGFYEYNAALESVSPLTRIAIERIGWDNLCMSENHVASRANFREIYNGVVQGEVAKRQVPANVAALIEEIQNNEHKKFALPEL